MVAALIAGLGGLKISPKSGNVKSSKSKTSSASVSKDDEATSG